MKLFEVAFQNPRIDTDVELYFKAQGKYIVQNNCIFFEPQSKINFGTYFNSLSIGKYLQYTKVKEFYINYDIIGSGIIKVFYSYKDKLTDKIITKLLQHISFDCKRRDELSCKIPTKYNNAIEGMIYFQIEASKKGCNLYGASYEADIEGDVEDIKLAINVCTYKREHLVMENINYLENYISKNNLDIKMFIIDNGQTLKCRTSNIVNIIPNKNSGGSGGFRRGMIEIVASNSEYTHILIMDDDTIMDGYILNKLNTFLQILKPEFKEIWLGGSMLYLEKTYLQFDAGGQERGRRFLLKVDFFDQTSSHVYLTTSATTSLLLCLWEELV